MPSQHFGDKACWLHVDDTNNNTAIDSNTTTVSESNNVTLTMEANIDDSSSSSTDGNDTVATKPDASSSTSEVGKQSSSSSSPLLYNITIQSLDLGWNNLGQPQQVASRNNDDDDEFGGGGGMDTTSPSERRRRKRRTQEQHKQSKAFLKSLTKLIESPSCPQTLRFQVCGLGPSACRAIGKVRMFYVFLSLKKVGRKQKQT